jgi:hypothetical protein
MRTQDGVPIWGPKLIAARVALAFFLKNKRDTTKYVHVMALTQYCTILLYVYGHDDRRIACLMLVSSRACWLDWKLW